MKKYKNPSSQSFRDIKPNDLRATVLELLASSEQALTKNQIARHLGVRGDDRIALKHILADLEESGKLDRGNRRRLTVKDRPLAIGQIFIVEVMGLGDSADLIATPLEWNSDQPKPTIELLAQRRTKQYRGRTITPGIGAHVLIRIHAQVDGLWQGEVLKLLERKAKDHLGIFTLNPAGGGRLSPCHRKDTFPGVRLTSHEAANLQDGDIVSYAPHAGQSTTIHKVIGSIDNPKTFSQIAIHAHQIPHTFSPEAIEISERGRIPDLGNRTDFRHLPLVTIDGEDARDFDDAVWATADTDSNNPDGWRILVAIADVSYYVREGTVLDREAKDRGNSVYFPDQVVPMLPEALSNELCSLKPHVDRACMAIEMILSADGKVKAHRVKRGLMRSQARLTYRQVQEAIDGSPDETTLPLLDTVIKPLYGAYQSLLKARKRRGTLEIEQPERQVIFGEDGHINRVIPRPHYKSHQLIEEFMIAANVAAARTLSTKGWPCLYRIHDAPDSLRVANLREMLRKLKLPFTKAIHPLPAQFNEVLGAAKKLPTTQMISDLILRCQSQAKYSPINIGHYGLSLSQYAHFTSPIRRYSDLVVHRSLISALNFGEDGLANKSEHLISLGDHLSSTERRASIAEREVMDRFVTAYHAAHVGQIFTTTIVGVNKAGLFVSLPETGAQGFIPRSSLIGDTFFHEEENHRLIGRRSKISYQLGDHLEARLEMAEITTNNLIFKVVDGERPLRKNDQKKAYAPDNKEGSKKKYSNKKKQNHLPPQTKTKKEQNEKSLKKSRNFQRDQV